MTEPTDLMSIALNQTIPLFIFNFERYAIAATAITLIVWLLKRTSWKSRQIQGRSPSFKDFGREFIASIGAIFIFIVLNILMNWGFVNGFLTEYKSASNIWIILAYGVAMTLGHDTYFYWTHRAMHTRLLFKAFHRYHHRSVTPSPWTAYSLSIPEAAVSFLYIPLWLYFIPTPRWAVFGFVIFQIIRNTMQHAGLEIHPRGWASHPILKWISTTTHHDMHHSGNFKANYGFYLTFWDKIMGTEHPDYVATFDRVTGNEPRQEHFRNAVDAMR